MLIPLTSVSLVLLIIVIVLLVGIASFIAYCKGCADGELEARKTFRLICVECRWNMRPPLAKPSQPKDQPPKEEPRVSKVHF